MLSRRNGCGVSAGLIDTSKDASTSSSKSTMSGPSTPTPLRSSRTRAARSGSRRASNVAGRRTNLRWGHVIVTPREVIVCYCSGLYKTFFVGGGVAFRGEGV